MFQTLQKQESGKSFKHQNSKFSSFCVHIHNLSILWMLKHPSLAHHIHLFIVVNFRLLSRSRCAGLIFSRKN